MAKLVVVLVNALCMHVISQYNVPDPLCLIAEELPVNTEIWISSSTYNNNNNDGYIIFTVNAYQDINVLLTQDKKCENSISNGCWNVNIDEGNQDTSRMFFEYTTGIELAEQTGINTNLNGSNQTFWISWNKASDYLRFGNSQNVGDNILIDSSFQFNVLVNYIGFKSVFQDAMIYVFTQCTPEPTQTPTVSPIIPPTMTPSNIPTLTSNIPTLTSNVPTQTPSMFPTQTPSSTPTLSPSITPTNVPTNIPTNIPTTNPTINPTDFPTNNPSISPTDIPSESPSSAPSEYPTANPTSTPSKIPTLTPTLTPSVHPTRYSIEPVSLPPTNIPSVEPTLFPTQSPSKTGMLFKHIFNNPSSNHTTHTI